MLAGMSLSRQWIPDSFGSDVMSSLAAGDVVGDRYVIEGLLGEGGMGRVWAARHRFTNERVALKMLHAHLLARSDLTARFLTEARAPAAIGHPGIVRVLDAGTTGNGEPYFAMELLDGEPLAALMRRGPLPFEEIRRLCLEVLGALGAAHAAGFIHRDLKPENVFLCAPNRSVKLLDFGIAKSLSDLGGESQTATGTSMGTLHYMSPEQLRNAKRVDHRTDLWAAGVIFFQLVSGQLPYDAESMGEMLLLVLSSPPRALSERLERVPEPLAAFVACALAVDPNARFSSATEMAAALAALPALSLEYRAGWVPQGAVARHPVAPTLTAGPVVPPAPTRRVVWVVGAVVLLAASLGLGALLVGVVSMLLESRSALADLDQAAAEGEPCAVACKRIEGCGAVFERQACVTACRESPPTRECVRNADCPGIGSCLTELYCGKKPAGKLTCSQVTSREAECPNEDKDCYCRAMLEAAPAEAGKVIVNNSCALTTCQLECGSVMGSREKCVSCYNQKCLGPMAVCRAP